MTIFVSNVGCHVTGADLYHLFAAIGDVASAHVVMDKETGKSLRYGFVEMTDDKCGKDAIAKLHGKVLEGRMMSVAAAKAKNVMPATMSLKRVPLSSVRLRRLV